MREVAVNLNVGNLMLLLQFGNMSKELTKYNTKLFAEQVMPKLQPTCSPSGSIAGGRSRWHAAQRAAVPGLQPRLAAE